MIMKYITDSLFVRSMFLSSKDNILVLGGLGYVGTEIYIKVSEHNPHENDVEKYTAFVSSYQDNKLQLVEQNSSNNIGTFVISNRKSNWVFAGHKFLDVKNVKQIKQFIDDFNITKIIYLAFKYSDDNDTDSIMEGYFVNSYAPVYIEKVCNIPLIYISSDYVLNNQKTKCGFCKHYDYTKLDDLGILAKTVQKDLKTLSKIQYKENIEPLNSYAMSKHLGEIGLQYFSSISNIKSHVIRTSHIYSHKETSLIGKFLTSIYANEKVSLYDDVYFSPTYVCNLAKYIIEIADTYLDVQTDNFEITFYTDNVCVTPYTLFMETLDALYFVCKRDFASCVVKNNHTYDTVLYKRHLKKYDFSNIEIHMAELSEDFFTRKNRIPKNSCMIDKKWKHNSVANQLIVPSHTECIVKSVENYIKEHFYPKWMV